MAGNGWTEIRLGDVCIKIGSGATPRGGSEVYLTAGVAALIRSQNVHNHGFQKDGLAFLDQKHADELNNVVVEDGDVLLNITGDSVARCTQVPKWVLPARVNQHVAIIRPRCDELDPRFLRYCLVSPSMQADLLALAAAGATRNALTKGMIENLRVHAPPVATQRAIAHILGTLDDKIELNRRMNETLEGMARAIFKSWFVNFDPVRAKADARQPAGMDAATAALFPDSFEDSPLGKIPKGWVNTMIGEELDFLAGHAFKSADFGIELPGARLARGDNVKEGFFHWGDKTRYLPIITPEIERYCLRSGDTLIGMDGSKVGKNWVRVRKMDLPCLLVQRVTRLRPKHEIGENFIWLLVSDERFRDYVEAVKTGTSIPHISGGQIQSYEFLHPPRRDNRILDRFELVVGSLVAKGDVCHEEIASLASIRDSLLPKLLSGEIRLSVAEATVAGAV